MCGRYVMKRNKSQLAMHFALEHVLCELWPSWNIAPSQHVPVVLAPEGERLLTCMQWGLVPSWAKDAAISAKLLNARSETAAQKPSFRESFRHRRCLVVADGFYEWRRERGKKWPMYISLREDRPFAMAGLWDRWRTPQGAWLDSFTVLTTDANSFVKPVHHRMPVILAPEGYGPWLDVSRPPPQALLRPCEPELLQMVPVDPRVNSVRYNKPICIEPWQAPAQPLQGELFS